MASRYRKAATSDHMLAEYYAGKKNFDNEKDSCREFCELDLRSWAIHFRQTIPDASKLNTLD